MTIETRIRSAVIGDAERLKEIGVTGWETTYAGFLSQANRRVYLNGKFWSRERLRTVITDKQSIALVADLNGRVIGFITVEPHGDHEAELTRLYVDPQARSAGVGRALWASSLERLHDQGVESVLVNVFGDNRDGRRFYEEIGFILIEETTTDVGTQTVYDVWYRLEL